MSTAPTLDFETDRVEDMGMLAAYGLSVLSLQGALSGADSNANVIPKIIRRMARDRSWRRYILGQEGKVYRWDVDAFQKFIESPRSEGGCETDIKVLERMVKDTPAWPSFLELMRGEPGGPNNDLKNQGRSEDGTFTTVNHNNIIVDGDPPETIPLPTPRPALCGTSTSYLLRQLERGVRLKNGDRLLPRPDLLEKVHAGEMTPNAAAVLAGFRPKAITIPAEVAGAARRLCLHFQGADLVALIRHLEAILHDQEGDAVTNT